jgi:hypothetical protein
VVRERGTADRIPRRLEACSRPFYGVRKLATGLLIMYLRSTRVHLAVSQVTRLHTSESKLCSAAGQLRGHHDRRGAGRFHGLWLVARAPAGQWAADSGLGALDPALPMMLDEIANIAPLRKHSIYRSSLARQSVQLAAVPIGKEESVQSHSPCGIDGSRVVAASLSCSGNSPRFTPWRSKGQAEPWLCSATAKTVPADLPIHRVGFVHGPLPLEVLPMVRRLWGCYSVADHLEDRAFVADLLLYDRLVVPVPARNDMARGERNEWRPERQEKLLSILDGGGFVERVEWSAPLREQFDREWSPGDMALDIHQIKSPFAATRRIITQQLSEKVINEEDVRAVAVYAKPDRFDREWELTRMLPFVRRTTRVEPGVLREVADSAPLERQQLAKVIVTRLVVPDDGRSDEEVLKRTVELVSSGDMSRRRAEFHELVASFEAEGRRDETIVGEIEDLLKAYNESVRRHTKAQRARVAVQVLTTAEGAAGLFAAPAAIAAGPTAAIGEAMIRRRWGGDPSDSELGAVALLAEAQRAL